MRKHFLILVLIVGFVQCSKKEGEQAITSLSPVAFQTQLKETPDAVLLDVRTLEEVQAGRINGEINFDFKAPEFELLIKGLDKTKPYFVYCASGVRSGKAADKMEEEGFEKIYVLEGGIKAWEGAGLPVIR